MAKVKPLSQDITKGFKGVILFRKSQGQHIAQAWPRKRPGKGTDAQEFCKDVKRGCHAAAKEISPAIREHLKENTRPSGFTWLDYWMSLCMKAYYSTGILPVYLLDFSYWFSSPTLHIAYTLSEAMKVKITKHIIKGAFPVKEHPTKKGLEGCQVPDDPPPDEEENIYPWETDPTEKEEEGSWAGVAMSGDGQHQTAIQYPRGIHTSHDYGQTWTRKGIITNPLGVDMSESGQHQTVGGYHAYLYISHDYGKTWTTKTIYKYWRDIAVSESGQYQLATTSGSHLYISSNYGEGWTRKTVYTYLRGAAMSNSGQYQTAGGYNNYIYVSGDYGATWSQKGTVGEWWVGMSGDGQHQTAVSAIGAIDVSHDYGQNWRATGSCGKGGAVAVSDSGQWQAVCGYNEYIYVSGDYGEGWIPRYIKKYWRGVATDNSGQWLTAVTGQSGQLGYIYIWPGKSGQHTVEFSITKGETYIQFNGQDEEKIVGPFILIK